MTVPSAGIQLEFFIICHSSIIRSRIFCVRYRFQTGGTPLFLFGVRRRLLVILAEAFLGHAVLATAGYNAGPGRARQWRAEKPLEGAIYAESISQLVLASCWEPEFAAAIGLAITGCDPLSVDFLVMLDDALTHGLPWGEKLARLTQRPARDVLRRALAWFYVHRRIS